MIYVHIFHGNKKASSVDAKKVRAALAYHIDIHGLEKLDTFNYDEYTFTSLKNHIITIKKST